MVASGKATRSVSLRMGSSSRMTFQSAAGADLPRRTPGIGPHRATMGANLAPASLRIAQAEPTSNNAQKLSRKRRAVDVLMSDSRPGCQDNDLQGFYTMARPAPNIFPWQTGTVQGRLSIV